MVLSEAEEVLASDVTPEQAEEVSPLLGEATSPGWAERLRTWPATAETDAETIDRNDVTNRCKSEAGRPFVRARSGPIAPFPFGRISTLLALPPKSGTGSLVAA